MTAAAAWRSAATLHLRDQSMERGLHGDKGGCPRNNTSRPSGKRFVAVLVSFLLYLGIPLTRATTYSRCHFFALPGEYAL